jgi:hypothetical protein
MHEPKPKHKSPSSEINIYREACRDLVANHPKLSPLRRVVLMRLTHYINRHTWDAFVSEETLAKDCRTNTRTVRRALADGKALGIIERTVRGSQYTGASHHVFKLRQRDTLDVRDKDNRTLEADNRTPQARQPDSSVPLTSEEHLINLLVEVAQPSASPTEKINSEGKEGAGEESKFGKPRWTRPIVYAERPQTPEDDVELEEVYRAGVVPRRWWIPADPEW